MVAIRKVSVVKKLLLAKLGTAIIPADAKEICLIK
jgi:hypothetical protein